MSDRDDWTVQSRLVLGAFVCAVLLIVGYFVLVSTSWGHQFDDDAFFGRLTLNRKIIRLDSDMLDLVTKAVLPLSAAIVLVIAAVRRCALVGVVSLTAWYGWQLRAVDWPHDRAHIDDAKKCSHPHIVTGTENEEKTTRQTKKADSCGYASLLPSLPRSA